MIYKKILKYSKRFNFEYDYISKNLFLKGLFKTYLYKSNTFCFYNNIFLSKNIQILDILNLIIKNTFYGWWIQLKIEGWNFYWLKNKFFNFLTIHLGFSHDFLYIFFNSFFRCKKRILYIFTINVIYLKYIIFILKSIRFITSYKIKGILSYNEKIIIKSGKKEKNL